MDPHIRKRIDEWLTPDYDEATRKEIQALVDSGNEKELVDRFYQELEFGTGGLRGVLGAGSNRMNRYNVAKATQGLANYLLRKGGADKGVVVGRDSRIQSDVFAWETAGVLLANGIRVHFFDDIHPTPTVSFAVRELQAQAGVMVTASHNPREYNGYKVFWDDGCQVTPPADGEIIEEVRKIDSLSKVKSLPPDEVKKHPLFSVIDEKIDPRYLGRVAGVALSPEAVKAAPVKVLYSSLHGTGYRLVPESLKRWGFNDVHLLTEQCVPDGTFPTTSFPNPEEPEAMSLGTARAKEIGADVFIATDPDADRIGVVLKKEDGSFVLLNGNQIATLLVHYIVLRKKETGKLPANPRIIKTIVTTDLLSAIAAAEGIGVDEVLTGFKWIGLQMKQYETDPGKPVFLFGGEESHGYLAGDFVRDKDAVMSSSLMAELVAYHLSQGSSAWQVLQSIYRQYGYYSESQKSITLKGQDGSEQIRKLMTRLRTESVKTIGRYEVLKRTDVHSGEVFDMKSGKPAGKLALPKSDVVIFQLSDGAKVVGRPSGTEPKIKFYFTTAGKPQSAQESIDVLTARVNAENDALKAAFMALLGI
jgi:phosphoglucomutase